MTPRLVPTHIAKVRKNLTSEVLRALERATHQTSARQVARAAGLSEALLRQLGRGDFQVTPPVAAKLAGVFEQWGAQYRELARKVRGAARQVPTLRTGRQK